MNVTSPTTQGKVDLEQIWNTAVYSEMTATFDVGKTVYKHHYII